jgi:hypothetical protein
MILANRRQRPWALLAPSLLLGSSAAFGQGADTISYAVECVSLARVTRTEVLDEQTILFHMRGQQNYSNYLPLECPGLDEQTRFTYRTTSGQLCNNDTITLLERGSQLRPGITCRLGRFVPASAERVVDLTLGENRRGASRNAIEVRRVELPPAADADAPSATDSPAATDRADH